MVKYAQTVTGPVAVERLGSTLMHEHILCDLRVGNDRGQPADPDAITPQTRFQIDYFQNRVPTNMFLDEDDVATEELNAFGRDGGGTIVELSIGGLSPKPERLAAISRASGINIIMGAGFYTEAYLDEDIRSAPTERLEQRMIAQVMEGAWGTDIRCGIIGEIGCSWPLAECERRLLVAAAQTQIATGAAITVHPGRHPDAPMEITDILLDAGATPARVVIGHMDRTIFDRERLLALLERGIVLEWDFFGIEKSQYWMNGVDLDLPTDYMRLDIISDLIAEGYGKQIAISHDLCTRTRLLHYGGHGYGHLLRNIRPLAQRRGFRADDLDQLLVKTPARLLGFLPEATT